MVYTEVKEAKGKKYYYRARSVRRKGKVKKERVYLGKDLNKAKLIKAEAEADKKLLMLNNLLTGEELKFLENIKKEYAKEPKETRENRYESFCSLFAYDSTAIEGNTLTLQETAQLLFENITPRKSLREINETLNHKKAFDFLLNYKEDIAKNFICELHKIIVQNTFKKDLEPQIGCFRNVQVYIRGVSWLPPKPSEVPKEIKSLLSWYSKNKKKLHPLVVASYFHAAFETIHPFVDGNGRIGRLLMNFILHKNNYPMANIPNSKKYRYYKALQEAQIKGNLTPLVKLLLDLLKEEKLFF